MYLSTALRIEWKEKLKIWRKINLTKALITGITGMVGSHLIDFLLSNTDCVPFKFESIGTKIIYYNTGNYSM